MTGVLSESLGLRSKVLRSIEELRTKMESLSSGIPDEFICPITRELMKDPVIASGVCGAVGLTQGVLGYPEDRGHFPQACGNRARFRIPIWFLLSGFFFPFKKKIRSKVNNRIPYIL